MGKTNTEHSKHKEKTINALAQKYSEPKAFWPGVRWLQGNTRGNIKYLAVIDKINDD